MKRNVELAIVLECAAAAAAVCTAYMSIWITLSLVDSMIKVLGLLPRKACMR
jgi:Na+/H+ antiporter NhaC